MSELTLTQERDYAGVVFTLKKDGNASSGSHTFYANDAIFAAGQKTVFWDDVLSDTDGRVSMPVELLQGFISNNISRLRISVSNSNNESVSQEMDIMSLPLQPTLTIKSGNNRLLLTVTENSDTNSGNKCNDTFNGIVTTFKSGVNEWKKHSLVFTEGDVIGVYEGIISELSNNIDYEIAVAANNSVGQGVFSDTSVVSPTLEPQGVNSINYDSSGNRVIVDVPEIDVCGNSIIAIKVKLVGENINRDISIFNGSEQLVDGKISNHIQTFELTNDELAAGEIKEVTAYLVASYDEDYGTDITTYRDYWKSTSCDNDTESMSLNFDISNVDLITGEQIFLVTVVTHDQSNVDHILSISSVDVSGNNKSEISISIDNTLWNNENLTASFTIEKDSIHYNKYLTGSFSRDNRDGVDSNERIITRTLTDPLEQFYLEPVNAFDSNIKPSSLNSPYTQTDSDIAEDISNGLISVSVTLDNIDQDVDNNGTFSFVAPAEGGWEQGKIYKSEYTVTKFMTVNISDLYKDYVSSDGNVLTTVSLGEFIFSSGSKIESVKFVPTVTRDTQGEVTDIEFSKVLLSGENNGAIKNSIRMLYANKNDGTLSDISFGEGNAGFDAMDGRDVDVFTDISFSLNNPINVTDNGDVVFITIQDDVNTLDNIVATRILDDDALQIYEDWRDALDASNNLSTILTNIQNYQTDISEKTDSYNNDSDVSYNDKTVSDLIEERIKLDNDIAQYVENEQSYNNISAMINSDIMNVGGESFEDKWLDGVIPSDRTKVMFDPPLSLTVMRQRVFVIGLIYDDDDDRYPGIISGLYSKAYTISKIQEKLSEAMDNEDFYESAKTKAYEKLNNTIQIA